MNTALKLGPIKTYEMFDKWYLRMREQELDKQLMLHPAVQKGITLKHIIADIKENAPWLLPMIMN